MERKDTQHRRSANSAAAAASGTEEVAAKVLRVKSIQHAASNPEQLHLFFGSVLKLGGGQKFLKNATIICEKAKTND